jgi:hypothetical protein
VIALLRRLTEPVTALLRRLVDGRWQLGDRPWTHIIPGNFFLPSKYTDLLCYDSAGTGAFYRTSGQGEIALLRQHTSWGSFGRPWTHIIPGNFSDGGYTDLLFYDSAGTGAFYRTYEGEIALLRTHTGWQLGGRPWTHIIPGNFFFPIKYTDLLFYTVPEQRSSTQPMDKARFFCVRGTPIGFPVGSSSFGLGSLSLMKPPSSASCSTMVPEQGHSSKLMVKARLLWLGTTPIGVPVGRLYKWVLGSSDWHGRAVSGSRGSNGYCRAMLPSLKLQ